MNPTPSISTVAAIAVERSGKSWESSHANRGQRFRRSRPRTIDAAAASVRRLAQSVFAAGDTLQHNAGEWGIGQQALEHTPRYPHHAKVFADFNAELHSLPRGIPSGVIGKGEEHRLSR